VSDFSPQKTYSSYTSLFDESSEIQHYHRKLLLELIGSNPPRFLRLSIDAVYETALWVKIQAQELHPVDAVRAHFWAFSGRRVLQRRAEASIAQVRGVY